MCNTFWFWFRLRICVRALFSLCGVAISNMFCALFFLYSSRREADQYSIRMNGYGLSGIPFWWFSNYTNGLACKKIYGVVRWSILCTALALKCRCRFLSHSLHFLLRIFKTLKVILLEWIHSIKANSFQGFFFPPPPKRIGGSCL